MSHVTRYLAPVLGIDPGDKQSAYVVIDRHTRKPIDVGLIENEALLEQLEDSFADMKYLVGVEMISSYGMPVGKTVFETVLWTGRFVQLAEMARCEWELIYRGKVKHHHCHSTAAKDGNVIQALVDRFAADTRNRGKGTKADPGWFYGFHDDIWQAYALAVLLADRIDPNGVPIA